MGARTFQAFHDKDEKSNTCFDFMNLDLKNYNIGSY